MVIKELLKIKRTESLRIAAKHRGRNVRIFGSVARMKRTNKAILICKRRYPYEEPERPAYRLS